MKGKNKCKSKSNETNKTLEMFKECGTTCLL